MKILLAIDHFIPEIGSAAHLFHELGRELSMKGHDVKVLTTFPRPYNLNEPIGKYKRKILLNEQIDGLEVIRVRCPLAPKDNLFFRGLEQFLVPCILFIRGLFLDKPDLIVVYSPPLPLAVTSWVLSRIKRCKVIVNIQDLYPQAIIDVGMLKNRSLIKIFRQIESFVYKNADYLTVHSNGNRDYLIEHGAPANKVEVIYNWVDTDFIRPIPKQEKFNGLDLKGKFVISYAGVLSPAQGLEVILDTAKLLEEKKDILFLLVGDGFAREALLKRAKGLSLSNIVFLPFQPKEKYRELLACSDVSLVCLRKDVATPVVPGKLMSIMASGRPVIASVPLMNDTVNIVKEADCGLIAEAGNAKALAGQILKLYENRRLLKDLGEKGRIYAEKHFSIHEGIDKYENIFSEVCINTKR